MLSIKFRLNFFDLKFIWFLKFKFLNEFLSLIILANSKFSKILILIASISDFKSISRKGSKVINPLVLSERFLLLKKKFLIFKIL